jgi:DNA-3-methyladenine glycosylase II
MNRILQTDAKINEYLMQADPVLKEIILSSPDITIPLDDDYFESLANAIIGQQLSGRVTEVIWKRLSDLLAGDINPKKLIETSDENLRAIGISNAKVSYLKNLSLAILQGTLDLDKLDLMQDDEVMKQLTAIKGIGNWTAEMFLIFSLNRPDVFSDGDGGLYRAVKKAYKLEKDPTRQQLQEISDKWRPYRTFASLYLWKSLEYAKDLPSE